MALIMQYGRILQKSHQDKDADAMTAAFKEYSAKVLKKHQTRKSVLAELHKAVAIAASLPQKAVDHVKNLHQDLSL